MIAKDAGKRVLPGSSPCVPSRRQDPRSHACTHWLFLSRIPLQASTASLSQAWGPGYGVMSPDRAASRDKQTAAVPLLWGPALKRLHTDNWATSWYIDETYFQMA